MEIKIVRKKRKSIGIWVRSSEYIEVLAPLNMPERLINNFVNEKRSWIMKKVAEHKVREAKVSDLTDGSFIYYLGKKFKLRVIKATKDSMEIMGNTIVLYTKKPTDYNYKLELTNVWYRNMGREVFPPILRKYLKLTNKSIEKLSIKTLKRNWGSCNPTTRSINLNSEMLKKDIRFIEYVILHEIAHLEHPNHSKDFHNYVAKFMPDWKKNKALGKL